MFYFTAALYAEAKPLIDSAGLKKDPSQNKFQLFRGDGRLLLLTGSGPIRAAVAVTWLFGICPPGPADYLVNLGVCGTRRPDWLPGRSFLCHKITDASSGRCCYPDFFFPHPFEESSLTTFPRIQNTPAFEGPLADMEAAGIGEAASLYLSPHQLIFYKTVSDVIREGPGSSLLTPEGISSLMASPTSALLNWLSGLPGLPDGTLLTAEETSALEDTVKRLSLTASMRAELMKQIMYYKCKGGRPALLLRRFLAEHINAGHTKTEGKYYFEQLKQGLS